jgi:hypothetical protein
MIQRLKSNAVPVAYPGGFTFQACAITSSPHTWQWSRTRRKQNKIIESKWENAKKAGATQNIGPYKAHKRREQREWGSAARGDISVHPFPGRQRWRQGVSRLFPSSPHPAPRPPRRSLPPTPSRPAAYERAFRSPQAGSSSSSPRRSLSRVSYWFLLATLIKWIESLDYAEGRSLALNE